MHHLKFKQSHSAESLLLQQIEQVDKFSVFEKLLKICHFNNMVMEQKTKFEYFLALENSHNYLKKESIILDNQMHSYEDLLSKLIDFKDQSNFLFIDILAKFQERIEIAYELIEKSNKDTQKNFYSLYFNVMSREREALKKILEDKLEARKSDEELEAECKRTGIYHLFILSGKSTLSLEPSQIAKLKEEFSDVKDAIEIMGKLNQCMTN